MNLSEIAGSGVSDFADDTDVRASFCPIRILLPLRPFIFLSWLTETPNLPPIPPSVSPLRTVYTSETSGVLSADAAGFSSVPAVLTAWAGFTEPGTTSFCPMRRFLLSMLFRSMRSLVLTPSFSAIPPGVSPFETV